MAELVAREYLTPLKEAGVDTLVLGCTHYPLLAEVIGAIMGPGVTLIDSGAACADYAGAWLRERDLLARRDVGACRYFVSDSTQDFARLASIFLGQPVTDPVERVEIEQY